MEKSIVNVGMTGKLILSGDIRHQKKLLCQLIILTHVELKE